MIKSIIPFYILIFRLSIINPLIVNSFDLEFPLIIIFSNSKLQFGPNWISLDRLYYYY